MINTAYYKLLVLSRDDKETGADEIMSAKNPGPEAKRDAGLFYQNYAAIVLKDDLSLHQFMGPHYKKLREAAFSVCPDKVILTEAINRLTPPSNDN